MASSRIEGTQADLGDLMRDELDSDQSPHVNDVREVRNYVKAMKLGLSELDRLPLSGRLICALHGELMSGVRGQEQTPGEYRRSQNWIGPPGSTLKNAAYVPPPVPEMHAWLQQWEIFINERDRMPELIQCALLHEHFEAIHPFLDGNGRIGRLLITLFLIQRGRLSKPLLYLSNYIERQKQRYYDCLQRISTYGDWPGWLRFFLAAVRDTARIAIVQSDRILTMRDMYRQQLKKQPRALTLLDQLFMNPYTTVAYAQQHMGVSRPTAQKAIDALVEIGLLTSASGRAWNRIWLARPILAALEADPPLPAEK